MTPRKASVSNGRSRSGRTTETLTVSVYPRQMETVHRVERQLNVSRSYVVQALLDEEEEKGVVRQRILRALQEPGGLEAA